MQDREDIASSVVVIAFGIVFLIYASRYPVDTLASPGPGTFPRIAGGFVVLLGAWQLLRSAWKRWRQERPAPPARSGGPVGEAEAARLRAGGWAAISLIAAFALYILGIKWIGFFASSFLFTVYVSRLAGKGDLWRAVLLSAGLCLFCYLVFVGWLKISFPSGLLF